MIRCRQVDDTIFCARMARRSIVYSACGNRAVRAFHAKKNHVVSCIPLADIVPFVQKKNRVKKNRVEKHRAFRLRKSCHSCLSCKEESCKEASCKEKSCIPLAEIVSFVPFVQRRIVPSACGNRIVRAIRAKKNRAFRLRKSCHSCHSCKNIPCNRVTRAFRARDWDLPI